MKKSVLTFVLLASSLVMLSAMPLFKNNIVAEAQGYDNYYGNSYYSAYPTEDKKYECRRGPFEGFFVGSVEFCKKAKFDDNKRDTKTGPPGPPGLGNNNSTLVNTFNCINPNVININTETNQSSSSSFSGLQTLQGSAAQGLIGNISGLSQIDLKKTIVNLCIINDNDNIVIEGGGNGTQPEICEECFTEFLTQPQIDTVISPFTSLEEFCFILLGNKEIGSENFINGLIAEGIPPVTAQNLTDCLERIGVNFI